MDYLRYYLGTTFMAAGIAGFVLGGGWVWLGASTFVLALVLDLLFSRPDYAKRNIRHPWLAEVPIYLHGLLVFGLLGSAAWRVHVSTVSGPPLGALGLAGVAVTLAWLGVLPNIPVVHDLIHRNSRFDRFLGFVLTVTVGDPLRRLAHLRGHHVDLGLEADSDTARRGETIYAFIVRAAVDSVRDVFRSERARLAKRGVSVWSWKSDVVRSLVLTLVVLTTIALTAGLTAFLVIASGMAVARLLLESFNYLQHYGLVRAPGTPYGRRHTWSHLSPVVRAAGFEITNHAHHHMNPNVRFYALEPDPTAPQMPSALVCFLAAMVPPLWVKLIAIPRLKDWDARYATPEERKLAAAANAKAGWPDWLSESTTSSVQGAPDAVAG